MKLDLVTSLWGDWHLSMYLGLALPTLMAPGNLPALARQCDLHYRIMTTPSGRRALSNSAVFQALRNSLDVEICLLGAGETPEVIVHIEMMHASLRTAAERRAYVAVVPPDVLWADGNFTNLATMLRERAPKGLAIPCIRIVSESAAPELLKLRGERSGLELALTSREVQTLVLRHLHPEQLSMIDGGPASRPTLWATFPVLHGGLIHCTFNREWFAAAPGELRVTEIFCNDESMNEDDYYVCQDANQMLMASLTPMRSYLADLRRNAPFQPIDVAATLNMAQHGVPFHWRYVGNPLALGDDTKNRADWTRTRRRARLWASHAMVLTRAHKFFDRLRRENYQFLAELVAYAIFEHDFLRHRRLRHPVICFVPDDLAIRWPADRQPALDDRDRLAALGDLGDFFTTRVWDHVSPLDAATAARLTEPPGTLDGEIEITSFSGVARRLRAIGGRLHVGDRRVLNTLTVDGNVLIVY